MSAAVWTRKVGGSQRTASNNAAMVCSGVLQGCGYLLDGVHCGVVGVCQGYK